MEHLALLLPDEFVGRLPSLPASPASTARTAWVAQDLGHHVIDLERPEIRSSPSAAPVRPRRPAAQHPWRIAARHCEASSAEPHRATTEPSHRSTFKSAVTLGIEALEKTWQNITRKPLPQAVLDYVESGGQHVG